MSSAPGFIQAFPGQTSSTADCFVVDDLSPRFVVRVVTRQRQMEVLLWLQKSRPGMMLSSVSLPSAEGTANALDLFVFFYRVCIYKMNVFYIYYYVKQILEYQKNVPEYGRSPQKVFITRRTFYSRLQSQPPTERFYLLPLSFQRFFTQDCGFV